MARIDRLSATLALEGSVGSVRGISSARRSVLSRMGIRTVRDLLTHYPKRYIDTTSIERIAEATIGDKVAVIGQVADVRLKRPRRNLPIVEVAVNDGTATLIASFFRQPWMKDKVKPGERVVLVGRLEFSYGYLRMSSPFMEAIDDDAALADGSLGMVPVHPAASRLSASQIRGIIRNALAITRGSFDPIPLELRLRRGLVPRSEALEGIHFPSSAEVRDSSRRRLVYEELLLMQLFLMRDAYDPRANEGALAHRVDGGRLARLMASLPFDLTSDQSKALEEVLGSLSSPRMTRRMLLGDVGTGKTIVAALAMAAVADNGTQSMLMAPTEVLAQQHHESLSGLLEGAGIRSALLTGSTDREARREVIRDFADGGIDVLIGTHALLEDDVVPKRATLIVIDEQQRFGVDQRARLIAKGDSPDALYLTATPIPRSLALAIFGGLELSYIRERPNDLSRRTTTVLPRADRGVAYEAAKEALARGEQAYVVCPLVGIGSEERSRLASDREGAAPPDRSGGKARPEGGRRTDDGRDAHVADDPDEARAPSVVIDDLSGFAQDDVASAKGEAEFLQRNVFADDVVGLLHGGMPSDEKKAVMESFRDGRIDVLVSTTVIEVGIDVPNATVMIIEDADRFGLSQLHQLRGRIGRGGLPSQAFLVSASGSKEAIDRLRKLEDTDDGFAISEFDLMLRREGDLLGYRQSGASVLKLVDIIGDAELIEMAHEDAECLLSEDPLLESPAHAPLARELEVLFDDDASPDAG